MCQILGACLAHFLDWNFITAIYKGFLERFDDHWEHSREVLDVTHTTVTHVGRETEMGGETIFLLEKPIMSLFVTATTATTTVTGFH